MPKSLAQSLPDYQLVTRMTVGEVGLYLLTYLRDLPDNHAHLNRHNLFHSPTVTLSEVPAALRDEIAQALLEAWDWLVREGYITRRVGAGHPDWVSISRAGRQVEIKGLTASGRGGALLPPNLHPSIPESARAAFARGDFATAAFEAFREVEIAVRDACGYSSSSYGVDLMRQAFSPASGPLRDASAETAEREAEAHLFAGAIGRFKNPLSHRRAEVSGPNVAGEIVGLASLLLRIVDERRP